MVIDDVGLGQGEYVKKKKQLYFLSQFFVYIRVVCLSSVRIEISLPVGDEVEFYNHMLPL